MNARRAIAGFLVTLATIGVVFAVAAPSQADHRELLVSRDATGPFKDHLAQPLFAGTGLLVPRDQVDATFYVKNNTSQRARTTLAVLNRGPSSDFAKSLRVGVDIDGTRSVGTVGLPDEPDCRMVTTGPSIRPGDIQAVDVSLTVGDLQNRVGTDEAASLDFVVTLTHTGDDGWVEVCGNQADPEPVVRGSEIVDPDPEPDPDGPPGISPGGEGCDRDVVVTAVGSPTCVPTVVDAGVSENQQRARRTLTVFGAILFALGAGILARAIQRRLDSDAPR